MIKFIATTSINNDPENTAYKHFVKFYSDWHLVISGDEQTDDQIYREFVAPYNATYLSIEDQKTLSPRLHQYFGTRTDARRMFSLLYAYRNNADVVALIDDDNYPTLNWGKTLYLDKEGKYPIYENVHTKVLDPLEVVGGSRIVWHRGYPVDRLHHKSLIEKTIGIKNTPLIQADLWYGEPDVDAMCRLIKSTNNYLEKIPIIYSKFPFMAKGFAPFNSQNTFLSRAIIPFYFQFTSLGRMSDIWIAYYLEALYNRPIVIYGNPTVTQQRNKHNVLKDFEREMLGYLKTSNLLDDLEKDLARFILYLRDIEEWQVYVDYQKGNI